MLRVAAILLAVALTATSVGAQETDEDRAFLEEVRQVFVRGGSHSARRDLAEYLKDFPDSTTALRLAAEVAWGRGDLDAVEAHLAGDKGIAPELWTRVLLRRGRYEEALEVAGGAELAPLAAGVLQVTALDALGRRTEALARAKQLTEETDDRGLDGEGLIDLGRLLHFQRRFELANQALVYADAELNGRQGPGYRLRQPEALVELARVYAATRQSGGGGVDPALKVLNEVLDVDASHPEALVVKALVYEYGMAAGKAREALRRALDRDPTHPEALFQRGRMALMTRQVRQALADAEMVLQGDPRHRGGLALHATALTVAGRKAEAGTARALYEQHHPESAALDALLGQVLQQHYRFAESIAPLERALAREPGDESPLPVLAQSLANLGREQEARAALEEHRRRSPFEYPWRENMLKVLARLQDAVEIEDESGFRLRLPPGEQDVLGRLLLARLTDAREEMSARWGVALDEEVLVEVFDRHADFSVRTVGFSGFMALGACFGDVFTLLSPLSEMRGQFHWAQTAVHEFAHVVTLKLSRQKVPRWLTEGVSVVEEKRIHPSWARELDRDVLDARANGMILPVARLDEAFRDGSTVMLGYYQGSLIVEVVERDFGFEKLRNLVAAYADDRSTPGAIRHALGIEPEELDRRLHSFLDEVVVARAAVRPRFTPAGKDALRQRLKQGDQEALMPLAAAYHDLGRTADRDAVLKRYLDRHGETPEIQRLLAERDLTEGRRVRARERLDVWREDAEQLDADGLVLIASLHLERGEHAEALEALWAAHALFPGDIAPGSPLRLMLSLLDADDDTEEWIRVAELIVAHDERALHLRRSLARRWMKAGRTDEALELLRQAVEIDPYRPDLRMELAERLVELGRPEEATTQWQLVLAMRADQVPVPSGGGGAGSLLGHPDAGDVEVKGPVDLEALQERARQALREATSAGD